MLRVTLWLLVGVFVCASCSITCPDGNVCSDSATCCETKHGYTCCPYPNGVCCSDLAHCCPSGFHCNAVTQMCERKPWMMMMPMVKKEVAEEPSPLVLPVSPLQEPVNKQVPDQKKSSIVQCDSYFACPDRTTCCRHPTGVWFCCPYAPGWCCRDGYHCCAWGYDCDLTYTHCVKWQGLRYPFAPDQSMASVPASLIVPSEEKSSLQETPMTAVVEASGVNAGDGVIRCDNKVYCSAGTSCCKASTGKWNCCPFSLGQCCADGHHCCEYGQTCNPISMACTKEYSEIPSRAQEDAKTV